MNEYLASTTHEFRTYESLVDRAMAFLDDDAFFTAPGPETNSVAINVKHLAGNLHSRWESYSVLAAIQRQLGHAAYHSGQVVQLAKHYAGDAWQPLTIAHGESEAHNERARARAREKGELP